MDNKLKRRFNWKGRQTKKVIVDNKETKKIVTDLPEVDVEKYDDCNALVLPSKKRKTKNEKEPPKQPAPLSKTQRKKLEKIVEKKEKKTNRAKLLEDLAKVQAPPEELALLTSTSNMHSKKLKRFPGDVLLVPPKTKTSSRKANSIRGSNVGQKVHELIWSDASSDEEGSDAKVKTEIDNEGNSIEDAAEEMSDDLKMNVEIITHSTETVTEASTAKPNNDVIKVKEEPVVRKPAIFVEVKRTPEVQECRMKLPIITEEQTIMETISENQVVIISGETGSGKTTQVPQFLYEAGYASQGQIIGITEPRRIAAITMANRVALEMNLPQSIVSYQIRFEGNATQDTKIKFMTDGVLMKEVESDFLLSKYSVIVIDEAHERSVYSDILIGLLSRIVPLRCKRGNPLKLIIMSATLRVEDFTENKHLFKVTPPVINVESRQFSVTIHFIKKTPDDYVKEAFRWVCKIHALPEGGILVFVTGQREVMTLCNMLRKKFPLRNDNKNNDNNDEDYEKKIMTEQEEILKRKGNNKKKRKCEHRPEMKEINLDDYASVPPEDDTHLAEMDEDDLDLDLEGSDDEIDILPSSSEVQGLYTLPLYSLLASEKQAQVFKPPPEGTRLCVIATNVAETSLTIPGIKYVVDTGKVKNRFYDKVTGVSVFDVCWTSKAAASQRAGRAGRTGPGHCYRLYSSAVFNDQFVKFADPEICKKPVDDLVLQMKSMGIDKVVNFPFPNAPSTEAIQAAERRLIHLGALDKPIISKRLDDMKKVEWSSRVSQLGKAMSCFPVSPRYSKMLALSHQHGLLPYTVALVAALTIQEVLLESPTSVKTGISNLKVVRDTWMKWRTTWAGQGQSFELGDAMVLLKALLQTESKGCTPAFCASHGLRYKAMIEIRKLRFQLTNTIGLVLPDVDMQLDPHMEPPSQAQSKLLRQILLSGSPFHVARKIPENEIKSGENKSQWRKAYRCVDIEDLVFIHSSSVLSKKRPQYVVYQEIIETSNKMYMKGVSSIEPEWLPIFCESLCALSNPMDDPPPRYDSTTGTVRCHMMVTYGKAAWPLPPVEMEYPSGPDKARHFAKFLLEGVICPDLAKYTPHLLSIPATMIKSWAKFQTRTDILLSALMAQGVDSRDKLQEAFDRNNHFLLQAYLDWLPHDLQGEVGLMWPPNVQE